MSLRIITGRAKGRRIEVPDLPEVRPTTDRVRQVLFDILADACVEATVLDLFAGSGALGIEAWSRGASSVTFVEQHPVACASLRGNLRRLGIEATVVATSVDAYLSHPTGAADLVFLDPPYASGLGSLTGVLASLGSSGSVASDGIVVAEAPTGFAWPAAFEGFRERRVGGTTIQFARFHGYDRDLPRDV